MTELKLSKEGIEALLAAHREVDRLARREVRSYLTSPLADLSERVQLHLGSRQFSGEGDPRMWSSHNYSGLGMALFDQAEEKKQLGDTEAHSRLRIQAHTLHTYASVLSNMRQQAKPQSLKDFTRKSVVGAGYRVGASFTIDAIYLTAVGATAYYLAKKAGLEDSIVHAASDFVKNLDPWKLGRVAAAVVAINFADYKWDITNRLDDGAKWIGKKAKSLIVKRNN